MTDTKIKIASKLVVLGNGFNLWLGFPTRYYDYKKFLELHEDLYPNCIRLLRMITKDANDMEWCTLEDDMFKFAIKYQKWDSSWKIDILRACWEKNQSLTAWVSSIKDKYTSEILRIQLLFNELLSQNEYYFWDFNYVIDWLNDTPDYRMGLINVLGMPPKRGFTQLHYRKGAHKDGDEILFGGDWTETSKLINCKHPSEDDKAFWRFCHKFYDVNLNPINNRSDLQSNAAAFGPDFPWDPLNQHLNDGLGLPTSNWTCLKSLFIIGLSLGSQDIKYFITSNSLNPFNWIMKNNGYFILSFYDEIGLIHTRIQWQNIEDNCFSDLHKYTKYEYIDICLKEIFGTKYIDLCAIRDQIKNK